jgi:hypothetical protein
MRRHGWSRAPRCCRAGDCELKARAGSAGARSQAGCAALPLAAARSVKKKQSRGGARCAEQGAAARRPASRRGRDGSMVETRSG